MNPVLFGTLLAAVALVLLVASSVRRRSHRELRARLFEMIAAAARRGVPIAPSIQRMADAERGMTRESLRAFAVRLDSGESIGSALAASMPGGTVPPDVLAAVGATEGTRGQRGTLESGEGRDERVRTAREQLSMARA